MDGREGNDKFSILSTSPELQVSVYGNKGSDQFYVTPRKVDPVISKNLRGHRGILEHTINSTTDELYNGLLVEGVAVDVLDNDGNQGYISFVETEAVHLLFEDDYDEHFFFTVFPTRMPEGLVSVNIVGQLDDNGETYMQLCHVGECLSNPEMDDVPRAIILNFTDITPQVVEVRYNPVAVPLNVTDENLLIKSVVDEVVSTDERFIATEQSIIPIDIKLIPSKTSEQAKSITIVEPTGKTIVAEGENGFGASYDIYLRPCSDEMKSDTELWINETVPDQVILDMYYINGDDWGTDCKVTVNVAAYDDDDAKGDHFVTLAHVATNKTSGGEEIK